MDLLYCPFRYSFQVPPRLELHVRPMLGEREVTLTHVTEWIEKKLQCEFQVSHMMNHIFLTYNYYLDRLLKWLCYFLLLNRKCLSCPIWMICICP